MTQNDRFDEGTIAALLLVWTAIISVFILIIAYTPILPYWIAPVGVAGLLFTIAPVGFYLINRKNRHPAT